MTDFGNCPPSVTVGLNKFESRIVIGQDRVSHQQSVSNCNFSMIEIQTKALVPILSLNSDSVNFSPNSSIKCDLEIRLVPVQNFANH